MIRGLLQRPWVAGLLCLAMILFFHSPRWWIIAQESPGTVEWDRASSYLKQCEAPLREDIEPGMRWRFIPQVFVWAFGGNRALALTIPWLGAWVLLAYLYRLARGNGLDEPTSYYATVLVGASAPVLVSTGWLGMNDAWVGLGLCYLAFGSRMPLVIAACVVCPLIDERFVFGVPLAVILREIESRRSGSIGSMFRVAGRCVLAIAPFVIIRLVGAVGGRGVETDHVFLWSSLSESTAYMWMAPLGGWMAFRFAYLPVMRSAAALFASDRFAACLLTCAAVIPVSVGFLLASDTMRTAGILLPLCAWAAIETGKGGGRKRLMWLALASLIFTAAHVTYDKVLPINSLPVELWRILR